MAKSKQQRQPRLPANDRVKIQGHAGIAWTVNWSRSGSCLLTEEAIEIGELLDVEFPERYARCKAEVVWAQSYHDGCLIGLEFLQLKRGAASREAFV